MSQTKLPLSLTLRLRRESVGVAWYASGGAFDVAQNGRSGDDPSAHQDNVWSAPTDVTTTHLWVVVRDDRGAASWRSAEAILH